MTALTIAGTSLDLTTISDDDLRALVHAVDDERHGRIQRARAEAAMSHSMALFVSAGGDMASFLARTQAATPDAASSTSSTTDATASSAAADPSTDPTSADYQGQHAADPAPADTTPTTDPTTPADDDQDPEPVIEPDDTLPTEVPPEPGNTGAHYDLGVTGAPEPVTVASLVAPDGPHVNDYPDDDPNDTPADQAAVTDTTQPTDQTGVIS